MRIDFTTAETALEPGAGQAIGAGQTAAAEGSGSSALPEDTAVFSGVSERSGDAGQQTAQTLTAQTLTAQALGPDAGRAGRVDSLRSAVADGSYALDPSAIADALVG